MIVYVDAHCHVDRYRDPATVAEAARAAGVVTVAVTDLPSAFQRLDLLLGGRAGLRLALGVHPLRATRATSIELSLFRRLLHRTAYVGEIGLDFSREGRRTRQQQLRVFDAILSSPAVGSKIMSVHSRGAEAECIDRLIDAGATAILHWYSGPLREIERALAAGFYFSVNPAMLRNQRGVRIVEHIPRERVLSESDGPYTRIGRRPTEPKDMPWFLEQLAIRWRIDAEAARELVYENMVRLFRSRAGHSQEPAAGELASRQR